MDEFELHTGQLVKGDLIVIEINGQIVPRLPTDPRPQWFVVLKDQKEDEAVPLKPFNNPTILHKARKYVGRLIPED